MSKYTYNKVQIYFNPKNKEEKRLWEKLEELTGIGRTTQGVIKEILYNTLINNNIEKKDEKNEEEEDFVRQFKEFD